MECCKSKFTFNKKEFIQMCVFLIAVGILICQTWSTFKTFIAFKTTVAISKETSKITPTIVVCQEHNWNNGFNGFQDYISDKVNISDEDWISNQFFLLNGKMNISFDETNLIVGNDTLNLIEVKELLNPWVGLCYAIIPDQSIPTLKLNSELTFKIQFSQDVINTAVVSTYLISQEDWYGFILADLGRLKPFKIPWPGLKTINWIGIEKKMYVQMQNTLENFYVPASKTNCKDYSFDDSFTKCQVKKTVACFDKNALDRSCTCRPKLFKLYYEIKPISLKWKECKNNSEYALCSQLMEWCQNDLISQCQLPCTKAEYNGQIIRFNGNQLRKNNEVIMLLQLATSDTEVHTETLKTDLSSFIGTVGGSLGLFIGFSLTGFIGQVLDFFMRD